MTSMQITGCVAKEMASEGGSQNGCSLQFCPSYGLRMMFERHMVSCLKLDHRTLQVDNNQEIL